jgi:predicted unusual protein kinase regulating ubiquinone biosynthesis (AarF/ABC1/UbiB family)
MPCRNEAPNIQIFSRQFIGEDRIYTPKILRELTAEQTITMQYTDGVKASEGESAQAEGL